MPDGPRRILVIDDSKVIRSLLTGELESRGFAVETAEDGTSGLAKACATTFDLILIDAMMPGLSGFEVCRKLAETRSEGKPRLVMFSNSSKDFAARQHAAGSGADAFLAKEGAARVANEVAKLIPSA
jgi:CheY-like chemotaxis protein